jgi:predicted dehydrogenase
MRVAVIGAKGSAGQRHCAAFQAEGCEVVEVEKGDANAQQSIEHSDAVSIATPDDLHVRHIGYARLHRKHIFCEKPLAHNRADLDWIADYVAGFQTFSCNLPLRYSKKLEGVDFYERTFLGLYTWGRPAKWGGWRGDIENYSIVAGGAIHLVDLFVREYEAPTHIWATRNYRSIFAHMLFSGASLDLWVDFESEGTHRVVLANENQIIKFDEPNDFRAPIHEFLEDVKAGRPGNGLEAIAANRVCLQIEEAAR